MTETSTALTYLGRRFNTAESDEQIWLRADELGHALVVDPPEQAVLDIHQEHFAQFSERLSILVPVETAGGPRLMRAFNLLGAYVLSTFVPNPQAQQFRRWLLETLIYFEIDIRREIQKLKEEDQRLKEYFETAIQALAEEVRALREAQAGRADRSWFEGQFRRWSKAQGETAVAVKALSARIGKARDLRPGPSLEEVAAVFRASLDPLTDGLAGLHERLEALPAGAGTAAALGTGVPVLTLPSQYSLSFHYEGARLSAMFWNRTGPWFMVHELAILLEPPDEDVRGIDRFLAARVPEEHRCSVRSEETGEAYPAVTETGLVLLFRSWSEAMPETDRQAVGRWIADQVIPSALSLRLKEVELDSEARPADFPLAPTTVLADRLFKVYVGEIDGRAAALVNARDLHKFLGFRQPYAGWIEDRCRWAGFRNGVHYVRVFVKIRQYDHYLTLDAAGSLLCQESHPKAVEAREYLLEVARERRTVIKGEATVAGEGELLPVSFRKTTLFLVNHRDEPFVPMKPVVEGMGLAWQAQHRKLTEDKERFCIIEMVMQMPGDDQRRAVTCLPLRKIMGWLMTISPNKVKPELKETIIAYQNECDEVLWQHWNNKTQRHRQGSDKAAPGQSTPFDTPPHQPLVIPFKEGIKEIPVRVAIRQDRPWFLAFDVALIVDEKYDDPRPAFAGLPEGYRDLRPSPDGESAALWVNEAGLAYYLGGRPHKPAAERLRDWLLKAVRPMLRERMGAAPVVAAAPPAAAAAVHVPAPVPREAYYTHRDPLYLACVALAGRLFRAGETRRTGGSAVSANYGRLLAWLWRNSPAEGWLEIGNVSRLAEQTGIPRRSLRRAIARTAAWGFAEQRPERPDGRPSEIRLVRVRLEAALGGAGLERRA
jgi:prophage antirepressor-like protein/phage anti-repressor protein